MDLVRHHIGMVAVRSRILKIIAVAVLLIIVVVGVEAYRIVSSLMAITGQTVSRAAVEPQIKVFPTLDGTQRINILLLGTDTDTKIAERQQPDTDTMLVVTIDPVHHSVAMLSIPRDFWVPIPGHGVHKINAAYSFGGIRLARETIERDFGITIDYYAWIGLNGFVKVVDTLGGVIVDATHPVVDDTYPADLNPLNPYAYTRVYIPAGPQYMDGTTALEYVRSRHGDLIGDFGRGARQEQVLLGLRQKATTVNVLLHLPDLVSALQGHLLTDLSLPEVVRMASFARGLNPGSIQRVVLKPPLYSNTATAWDGESIVVPHWTAIRPLIRQMFARPVVTRYRPSGRPITLHVSPGIHNNAKTGRQKAGTTRPARTRPRTGAGGAEPFRGRLIFARQGNLWSYDGSTVRRLTHSGDAADPSVTASGKQLVYVRRWSPVVSDIFTLNLRTWRHGQITQDRTADGDISDNVWAYDPAYAPDGSSIIFASDRYKLANPASDGRMIDLALYRYDTATGTLTQLTVPGTGAGGNADPKFDPANPNQVVFSSFYYLPNASVVSQLTLLNVASDQTTPLTPPSQQDLQPAFQPNGRHIAYIQNQNQSTRLLVAPFVNGTLRTRRATAIDAGMVSEPVYSPNGQELAYYKVVGTSFELWVAHLNGGELVGQPHALLTLTGLQGASPIVWTR